MKKIHGFFALLLLIFLVACTGEADNKEKENTIIWPTEEWPTSTPDAQGMDSEKLVEMFEYIENNNPDDLHGLLIIRNGHIVAEKYSWPFDPNYPHNVYSVTKSLTSAITGVAIDEGLIHLDDHVFDFFPDMTIANMSKEKENMTIEQLLTMTNGMDWPELQSENGVFIDWEASKNMLQYYLNQPIIKDQIGKFNYDTGAAATMGAIIEKVTGGSLPEYAQEKVFGKIGMDSLKWDKMNEGITHGGSYSEMTPRDMAKFGFLYLHNGNWDGKQIIPEDWVEASTSPHANVDEINDYGYFFWLTRGGKKPLIYAVGFQQQFITLVPKENLIIVQTSYKYDFNGLLHKFIDPAIVADEPLPQNKEANARLQELMSRN